MNKHKLFSITFLLIFFSFAFLKNRLHAYNKSAEKKDFRYTIFYSRKFRKLHLTIFNGKKRKTIIQCIFINNRIRENKTLKALPYHIKYFQFNMIKKGIVTILLRYKYQFEKTNFKTIDKIVFRTR